MRRFLKFLHVTSGAMMIGGLAAYMIALINAPDIQTLSEFTTLRVALDQVVSWLLLPGVVIAIASGLLAMAFHWPYQDAPWVWCKILTGLPLFEATFMALDGPSGKTAAAAVRASAGEIDLDQLAALVHDAWGAWWLILGLAIVNVALAIWRPRFGLKR